VAASAQPSQTPFSQQAFIVVRVDHKAGNDDAYLFVNPTLNSEPSVSSAAARSTNGFDFSFNRIRPFAGNYDTANSRPFAELLLDEIRIGETFASVTPFTPGTGGPPTLSISRSGNQVEISWSAGILESASSLSGTWSTVQGAAPPSYKTTPDGTQKYFRVRQ
jgi:hypothetical protein